MYFLFFKQKTAYEMRISDWSSDVCSSDLHEFNRRGKDRKLKPKSEAVVVEVPPIIDQGTYDTVQAHLQARNPKKVPPRVVSGPTLLKIGRASCRERVCQYV